MPELNRYDAANAHVRHAYEAAQRSRKAYDEAEGDLNAQHAELRVARVLAKRLSKRAAWCAACAWDGIDPNAPMVTWTDGNPYAARYDKLIR